MPELEQLARGLGVSAAAVVCEPSALVVLGMLAQVTRGGDDGFGGAGDLGSL